MYLLTGEPISGTILELLWAEGRPNNVNGSEHCVVMTREGLLDDRPCSDVYPFVCKIFGNETKYNEACDNYDEGWFNIYFILKINIFLNKNEYFFV